MSESPPNTKEPPARVRRLCQRARQCGEPFVWVSGRWVLGGTEHERRASLRLLARWRLSVLVADENRTLLPGGRELRHARPRHWQDSED